ncbi:MAG TPA: MarR family transcriptional regulator [Actinomycetota bacterium]|nr:MarR family transcriptional regulator [Actinomycetota bacterium]
MELVETTDRRAGLVAWVALQRAAAVLAEGVGEELEREAGLPLTWYDVLARLDAAPDGRLPMHELADSVLFSKSGLTRLVDRMAEAGLVRRVACPTDRRVTNAEITPRGRRRLTAATPVLLASLERRLWRHLPREDLDELRAVLLRVLVANGYPEEECTRGPAGA